MHIPRDTRISCKVTVQGASMIEMVREARRMAVPFFVGLALNSEDPNPWDLHVSFEDAIEQAETFKDLDRPNGDVALWEGTALVTYDLNEEVSKRLQDNA